MDRLQARILRDIAQQDQQQAARRDGHRCDYTCDCEEWIEIPLDSTHCPSPPPPPQPITLGERLFVACLIFLALAGVASICEWLSRGAF